jgi:hypothetical protein
MLEDKDKFIERYCEAVKHLHRPVQPRSGREPGPSPNPFGLEHKPLPDPYYDPDVQRRIGALIGQIAMQPKKLRRSSFSSDKK